MNTKRLFRGPLPWLFVMLLAVFLLSRVLDSGETFEEVDTARVVAEINEENVQSAKIYGGDAREIELTLKDGEQITAQYVEDQGIELVNQLQEQAAAGDLPDGYDVEITQPSVLWGILGAFLPFLLLAALFIFFLTQMQGGGNRVMNFGKNRAKLLRRRARLYGRIAATRKLVLHELSRRLAGGFDLVCIEDLHVAGMARRKGLRNGRSVAEVSLGELCRQLNYKTFDRNATLVRVGRFYPSSQICSRCGARAKLPLRQRIYDCAACGLVLDRDVNAARNIRAEGERLQREQQHEHDQRDVASIRGETQNGEPRPGETEPAQQHRAGGHGSLEAATDPAATPEVAA